MVVASVFVGLAFASSMQNPGQNALPVQVQHLDREEAFRYPWGSIRWLMNGKIDPDAEQTFGIVEINAGQSNALHLHPNSEELLYVLSGSCEHIVGDKKVTLHPGDLVRIPRNTNHQAFVTGKEALRAVISYSTPDRQVLNAGDKKE
jgi:quercetin dioxygenase-like cupin family protein